MSGGKPDYAELARRILTQVSAERGGAATYAAVVGEVHAKLEQRLVPLVGALGSRALFARSLHVTCRAFPRLAARVGAQRSVTSTEDAASVEAFGQLDEATARSAGVALYTTLLELIATLIGERLLMLILERAFLALGARRMQESEP